MKSQRRPHKNWRVFQFITLVAILLAGCGMLPGTTSPATPPAAVATIASTPTAQPTATPAGALARAQLLRLAGSEPATLDPGLATDTPAIEIIGALFDGLLTFDAEGIPRPRLAEKWDVSPDGRTYTFTLRAGARWSDGEPVRARDFEWAIWRNLDPATASDYASVLYPIQGAEAFNTKKTNDRGAVAILARDDRTLTITLERPAAHMLRVLSLWIAYPLPRRIMERYGTKWTEPANIVTNGPFRLETWKHDEALTLVRNNDYWGPKPTIEKVLYRLQPPTERAPAQAVELFERGDVDLTGDHILGPDEFGRIQSDPALTAALRTVPMASSYFLVFNSRKAPFDKPEVRRALGIALDPKKVLESVGNVGTPATSLVPEGIPGRKPDAYEARPNVEKARQLLQQAGFPGGAGFPEITYTYNRSDNHRAVAEYVQRVWQSELGLKVKLDPMEWRRFLSWRRDANYDVIRGGWQSDLEDPYSWFNLLLDSKQSDAVFAPHWKNEQFDRFVQQAAGDNDLVRRRIFYERADEIVAGEMPVVPLFYEIRRELVRPTVDGFSRTRALGILDLRVIRMVERR